MLRARWISLACLVCWACDQSTSTPAPTAEPPTAAAETASAEPPPTAVAPTAEQPEAPAPSASAQPSKPAVTAKPAATAKATVTAKAPAAPTAAVKPTADTPERKVKTVRGSAASGDGFAVSIQAPSPVRAGQQAAATVALVSKAPYKCNLKYPYKFTTSGGSGVSYPSSVVRNMSVTEKSGSMSVPFTPQSKGKVTVSGQLSFSVCTADKCLIEKRPLTVTVEAD